MKIFRFGLPLYKKIIKNFSQGKGYGKNASVKKIREITFVNAKDVLGVIYSSKSGNTSLKWRQTRKNTGKVTGEASSNSLVNLAEGGVITLEWVEKYVQKKQEESN